MTISYVLYEHYQSLTCYSMLAASHRAPAFWLSETQKLTEAAEGCPMMMKAALLGSFQSSS